MLKQVLFILLTLGLGTQVLGQSIYSETIQTHNPDPNWMDTSVEEYQSQISSYKPFRSEVIIGCTDDYPEMIILMEEGLSDSIGISLLQQWVDDIQSEGHSAELVEISYATPSEIRLFLDSLYTQGLEGSVFVGNLPTAWVAVWDTQLNMGEQLPCDYYFMDLNGEWLDLWIGYPRDSIPGQDGFLDTFQGAQAPEIWTGRIRVDNLSESEDPIVILQNYLIRNHEWRTNGDPNPVKALCYVDDDWSVSGGTFQAAMQLLYENVILVDSNSVTTAQDYEEVRLPDTYSWISPHVHSTPLKHFWQPSAGITEWSEIVSIAPPAHFYNLFACSNCRFTTDNYMGGVYSFASESGLAAVGSTTSGAMLFFAQFYGPLGGGASLGEAFQLWWNYIAYNGISQPELNWHIGMTLLGDPSLIPSKHLTGITSSFEEPEDMEIRVEANPSSGGTVSLNILLAAEGNVVLTIFDLSGRQIMQQTLQNQVSGSYTFEVTGLSTGIYFISAASGYSYVRQSFIVIK